MKRTFSLFVFVSILFSLTVSAATIPTKPAVKAPVLNAKNIMLPVGNTGHVVSLFDLAYISVKDFEKLTTANLTVWDKIGFKLAQKKLRSKLNADGTIKTDVAKKLVTTMSSDETGFHTGGFFLGLFFSWLGVAVAYLIKDDKRKSRIKWAWIGAAVGILYIVFLITLFLARRL